jgi:hypothetical protein
MVEALHPGTDPDDPRTGLWRSQIQLLNVDVRGVMPFAGNTVAEGGHADGRGLAARFREPFDLARLPAPDPQPPGQWDLVVTDPRSHVLRRVDADGEVTTFCGQADQPGHRDSPGMLQGLASWFRGEPAGGALFRRPTYLALDVHRWTGLLRGRDLLVSDSGNHVIRRVSQDGKVATAAGIPGQAGHQDGDDPMRVRFHDPHRIAVDDLGNAYVADRGNHVIRRIASDGKVTTLAGSPGRAGTADGAGPEARFSDLKGLACRPSVHQDWALYVLDGHAVRKLNLRDGVVTTVLGRADAPGFLDVPGHEADGPLDLGNRLLALRRPCLNDPAGIRCAENLLLIADRGNHAIRVADLAGAHLTTLAGTPERPETRWGLLRDGVPGPPDPRHAALEAPTAIDFGGNGPERTGFVCAGRSLVLVHSGDPPGDQPQMGPMEYSPARRNAPFLVRCSVHTRNDRWQYTVRTFHYLVDFIEPDGTLAARLEGTESTAWPVVLAAVFTQAGTATVVFRAVTDQGVSVGGQATVQVED